MTNTIYLDEKYSTTKQIIKENPELIHNPEDKFKSVFFLPKVKNRKGEGGLRTKGYLKKSFEDKPLVSIITVVYNGEKYLEETILNVINQSYDNVEYIIIDGGSTDGTLDIIKKYENMIDYWVSEKDAGIYDAMNKGIDLVSGEWINFMNAGDKFYNKRTLLEIFNKNYFLEDIKIIYGDLNIDYGTHMNKLKAKTLNYLYKGMVFSHQSCFVESDYHKNNKFELQYKIASDFNLIYNAYLEKNIFKYINSTISTIIPYGLSDLNHLKVHKENFQIANKKTLLLHQKIYYYRKYIEILIKDFIKIIIRYKK